MTTEKRDLHADLAICNAASTGPWSLDGRDIRDGDGFLVAEVFSADDEDARFIAEARTGWPHAIERALAAERKLAKAEAEVVRLRDALGTIAESRRADLFDDGMDDIAIRRIASSALKEVPASDQR